MYAHETLPLAAPSEPRTAPRSAGAAGQAQHCSSSQSPRLCLGKGVYSARIAFLSTAAPRRGIPRPWATALTKAFPSWHSRFGVFPSRVR